MKKRGLSTIVGAVFMVIVMAGALNVTLWAMNEQERVTAAVTEKASESLDRLNEQIQVAGVRVDAGKLNMTVVNAGGQAAQLRSMYIVNETAMPKQQYRYDIDVPIDGRNSASNIGQSLPFVAKQNTAYSVRVVTEAGVAASARVAPVSQSALPMSLYVIPPTVTPGENVTLLYTVTNNSTDSYLSGGITPSITTSCTGCTLTQYAAPAPNVQVGKGTTGLFKWVYKVEGPDNTPVTFNATIANARQGNYVTEKSRIEVVDIAQQSFYTEIIISSDLVQKPEIFVIMPSPFGESAQQGLWGITIVNPTSAPMEVSRIVANIFTTHIQTNGKPLPIWDEDCVLTGIYPSTGWSCIQANQLEWKNTASPVTISPLSAASFRARIDPSNISEGDEPAFITSITAFTSMGQFAKTGYSGAVRDALAPMTNVYITDTTTPATALQNSHMLGYIGNIAGSSSTTLNIAFADLDSVASTYIKSGTKLVVTVPKGFTNVAVASYAGFAATPTVTEYTDGSTQVIATLAEHLGDAASTEAKILSITATTPVVPDERIFVLHSLVDGETDSNFSIGSFAQIALQVLP